MRLNGRFYRSRDENVFHGVYKYNSEYYKLNSSVGFTRLIQVLKVIVHCL